LYALAALEAPQVLTLVLLVVILEVVIVAMAFMAVKQAVAEVVQLI
jgi:hypothetical protein